MNKPAERSFYINSHSERGFWSNKDGWVKDLASATSYTLDEVKAGLGMPVSKENDAVLFEATAFLAAGDSLVYEDNGFDISPLCVLSGRSALTIARQDYQDGGTLEVDIPTSDEDCEAAVSRGAEDGLYVKAWVWVAMPVVTIKPVKVSEL